MVDHFMLPFDYKEEHLIELLEPYRQAVADEDHDTIIAINDIIAQVVENDGVSQAYLAKHEAEFRELYHLIKTSEVLISSLKDDIKNIQKDLVKRRKTSKKYNDIGTL